MFRLPPYPSPAAWKSLSPSQKTSTRASIASALAQSTSLPESKLDISAAIAFVSIYARDHARATLEGLIWGSDSKQDDKSIRQRVLVLAGKLGKQLELEALVDLAIVYAKTNSTQIRAILAHTQPSQVRAALLPAFTQLLSTSQGIYALRKTSYCVAAFLAVCPEDSLRVFARDKDFIVALAKVYEAGLADISRSYGGLELDGAREADEWERLFVETKVSLIDAFHIIIRTILSDLASAKGPSLAIEADRTFDIIFALLSSENNQASTPFFNRTLLADYQQSYDLAQTLAAALKNAQEKDARLDVLEASLRSFDDTERKPGALKILLRSSGIAVGVDNLGKGKGKSKAAPVEPEDPEIDLHVSQVLDILPEHDPAYIKALLKLPPYTNPSQVIDALLEGTAPSFEAISLSDEERIHDAARAVNERRNIFNEEKFDLSNVHIGKKTQDETTVLRDRTFIEQMKADILRRAEAISDEESEGEEGAKVKAVAYLEDDVDGVRVLGDGEQSEDSDHEDEKPSPETICELAYIRDPHLFDRDAQTRRSKARTELREKTGWADEQLEGWRIMLEKDPRKDKILQKHEFAGNQTPIVHNESGASTLVGRVGPDAFDDMGGAYENIEKRIAEMDKFREWSPGTDFDDYIASPRAYTI
ncbi:CUE domain-containing protein [Mycena indigotica]|uniref:CUE domain-containing protein n=1 Tax=Mycena indigotica TaxID=2126181 RepID=A0A8H6TIG8_9AGAR|nr:CUE domain-containing protein [Mycena indigotica]KAF7316330.1 CUE domain-containing protein [Mycena indigotica]